MTLSQPFLVGTFDLGAPNGWRERSDSKAYYFLNIGSIDMKPGGKLVEKRYVHHYYSNIPAGEMDFEVNWPVYQVVNNDRSLQAILEMRKNPPVIYPPAKLHFIIPPADAEPLDLLRKKLERKLNSPNLSKEDLTDALDSIEYTKHKELAPVVWRLIEKSPFSIRKNRQFISLTYELSSPLHHETDSQFVQLVSCRPWEHAPLIFDYWRETQARLLPKNIKKLVDSKPLSVRLLTYVTFSQQCEKEWTATLLRDARDLVRPLPPAEFTQLLRDLDDDSFVVREKASAKLEHLGERVEKQLKQASKKPLSLEAKRRIQIALKKITAAPYPPDCDHAIRYLIETVHSPEADAILAALAEGDPDMRLTQYVKSALKKRRTLPAGQ